MLDAIVGWYYLHENGDIIFRRELGGTAADLRDSQFVLCMWPLNPTNRAHAWNICVEGLAAGANKDRIMGLANLWGCGEADAGNYAQYLGVEIALDGNAWCVTGPGHRDLQQDAAGFGDTPVEAFADLCKSLGYKPSKIWGHSFKSLLEFADPASTQFGAGA